MNARAKHLLVQSFTGSRLLLAGAFVAVLSASSPGSVGAWTAVALLAVMELTDFLDGTLARRLGATSRFGELFDPYCDSVARLIVFFALAGANLAPLWLPAVLAIRDVSVAYVRILCMHTGRKVAARLSGKIKAIVQGTGAIVLALMPAWSGLETWAGQFRPIIAAVIAAVTIWSAVDYLISALKPRPE